MRREAVRTNWPTVAEKPARKALKGCIGLTIVLEEWSFAKEMDLTGWDGMDTWIDVTSFQDSRSWER